MPSATSNGSETPSARAQCVHLRDRRISKACSCVGAINKYDGDHGAFVRSRPTSCLWGSLALTVTSATFSAVSWRTLVEFIDRLLGIEAVGPGIRGAADHALVAKLASLAQCEELCARIWEDFDILNTVGGFDRLQAEAIKLLIG